MRQKLHFWCFTLLMFLGVQSLFAQQMEVSGVVKDATTGDVLPGVTVTVTGTSTATSTAENGTYRINVPNGNATLVFSLVGYGRYEVNVNNQTTINASLGEDQSQLSEVVVTAMGIERTERSLGYATQKVDATELNFNKQPNMVNALQGKVAGVTISSTGGAPGQGSSIQIRGINSIDPGRDNQPLFVIDGVLMDNSTSTFGDGAELRGMSNRAVDVNPDDIESINVLRGGAATALYGLRGVNGVIVITTKTGKAGRISINYSGTYGFENVNKFPEVQTTYTQGNTGVYDPNSFWPSFGPTIEEARRIDPTHPTRLYSHLEDAFDTGYQFRNNLSISGGSERVTFLSSLTQFNHNGIMPGTDFKNYQARLNLNAKISEKISAGVNMSFGNTGGSNYNAIRYNEQLTYWSPRHDIRDYMKEDGTMQSYGETTNPMYVANTNRLTNNLDRFIGNFNFSYKPFEWLDFSYRIGMDTYNEHRLRTAPGFRGLPGELLVSENGAFGANGRGFVFDYNTHYRSINSTFVASLKHSFENGLNGTLRLGHELYDRSIRNAGVEGADLTVYNWFDLGNANVLNVLRDERNVLDYRLGGIFGELTLDYKQFIYLTLTGRNDITSSLRRPNNSFFYPSATLSYIFTENIAMPAFITTGKARFSYASIGKDAAEYATSRGFRSYEGLPTGINGFTRANLLGDPNLKPEFTNTYEAGLDMSFLNDRLGFEFTYYHATSKDQIINIPVSAATGYEEAALNVGTMRNKGVELTVHGSPIRNENFSWNTSLNFSANRNLIVSLREDIRDSHISVASQSGYLNSAVSMRLVEGQPYGALFGTSYQRYYTSEELAAGLNQGIFIDDSRPLVIGADGFPIRNPISDQRIMGNAQPKWIAGWSNTLNYKNLSLNLLFDARIGQDKYNQLNNFYAAFGLAKYTEDRNEYRVFEGLLADGTPNTQLVWLGQGIDPTTVDPNEPGSGRNYGEGYYRNVYRGVSEHSVEDASWVRLRSATFSYSFPSEWLRGSFVQNATLSVTGNNLWLWTKYTGYDPEASSFPSGSNIDGFAGFTHPATRSFLFTLNVGF
ncbi:SusC/RagA family TonB-linked outer membrane protein [Olivibacter sp. SDN3]|uniref:SusC/RagA family TonB-linked outer membrane protein n=1 Tax=Olivibacter sp. SDN3 TaxID=2764720 RepID=UPI001650D843|nr:SusC/RagA family TonB-linked outer membrane protein [Olivibacter sp. SDN3]QNL48322.1 SusC/RagA family TonB-linked outer membrane protein [Olivibacter sp. SDN3]